MVSDVLLEGEVRRWILAALCESTHPAARLLSFTTARQSISFFDSRLDETTVSLANGHNIACVFVNDEVGPPVTDMLKEQGIQLIALRNAGCNNVDLGHLAKKELSLVHVPAYSPQAVAEHALALLQTLSRKAHKVNLTEKVYISSSSCPALLASRLILSISFSLPGVQPCARQELLLERRDARLCPARQDGRCPGHGQDWGVLRPYHDGDGLQRVGLRREGKPEAPGPTAARTCSRVGQLRI